MSCCLSQPNDSLAPQVTELGCEVTDGANHLGLIICTVCTLSKCADEHPEWSRSETCQIEKGRRGRDGWASTR